MFVGPSGWKIVWLVEQRLWSLYNDRFPGVTANYTKFQYPLGTNKWRISGGDGCDNQEHRQQIPLEAVSVGYDILCPGDPDWGEYWDLCLDQTLGQVQAGFA